ncbi:MAG: hypothetical protein PH343_02545, partial [Nitrospira sp.]|nr:hypothetical protein [Nitrospira sp.]
MSSYTPTSAQSQAVDEIGATISDACHTNDCDLDKEQSDHIHDVLVHWYWTSVQPNTKASETDDSILDDAETEFLAWWFQVKLVNMEDLFSKHINNSLTSLAKGFNNAVTQSHKKCVADKDPLQAAKILQRARQALLLALDTYGFDTAAAFEKVHKCLHFELDFQSELEAPTDLSKIQALVQLNYPDDSIHHLVGDGQENYLSFTLDTSSSGCTYTSALAGDTLNVISVRINWNLNLKKYASGKPFDTISMVMSPGHPLENVTLSCPKAPPIPMFSSPAGAWETIWNPFHNDEANADLGGYVIQDWTYVGTSIFATKVYSRSLSNNGITITEITTLDLKHTPLP